MLLGRDELTNAFSQISIGVKNRDLEESDLSIEMLDNCLYTYPIPPPDILIRTSGETRLSDFMIWQVICKINSFWLIYCYNIFFFSPYVHQCSHSYIYFASVLWPELTAWDFMIGVFMYQRNIDLFTRCKLSTNTMSLRAEEFVKNLKQKRFNSLYINEWSIIIIVFLYLV